MSEKGMVQLLAPFAAGVVIVVAFYVLGSLMAIIGELAGLGYDLYRVDVLSGIEYLLKDVTGFLFIFSGDYPVGSGIFAVICWIVLTILIELWILEN